MGVPLLWRFYFRLLYSVVIRRSLRRSKLEKQTGAEQKVMVLRSGVQSPQRVGAPFQSHASERGDDEVAKDSGQCFPRRSATTQKPLKNA